MKAIADALVYAVSYINCRSRGNDESGLDDADSSTLELIAATLRSATTAEKDALAAAAEQALTEELSAPSPRPELIEVYSQWMEAMFGDPVAGRPPSADRRIASIRTINAQGSSDVCNTSRR
jgi:hypothetical protein